MLFDSYFTIESKLGWHRSFPAVESTRGIRAQVVVFELLEEMVAWGCKNGMFTEQFQILPLELKVKYGGPQLSRQNKENELVSGWSAVVICI